MAQLGSHQVLHRFPPSSGLVLHPCVTAVITCGNLPSGMNHQGPGSLLVFVPGIWVALCAFYRIQMLRARARAQEGSWWPGGSRLHICFIVLCPCSSTPSKFVGVGYVSLETLSLGQTPDNPTKVDHLSLFSLSLHRHLQEFS